MALRGERIGTAYIKIIADGSGMDRSVKNAIEDSYADTDKINAKYGRTNREAYEKGYAKQAEKSDTFAETFRRQMSKLRGELDGQGRLDAKEYEQSFVREFRALFLQEDIFDDKARKDLWGGLWRRTPQQDKLATEAGERAGRIWREHFARTGDPTIDFGNLFRQTLHELDMQMDETTGKISRISDAAKKADRDTSRWGRDFSDTIGRTFGKGSRNDFLNFFGSMIGGLTRLGSKLINIGGLAEKLTGTLGTAFSGLAQKMGMSEEAVAMFGKLASNAAVAGATIGAIIILLGPVASLISGLAAAVTALASSVAFALSAGLGVLVSLLPLLAAGITATVLAFKGLEDVKGGKAVLEDLKDGFAGVKEELAEGALSGIKAFADTFGDMMQTLKDTGALRAIGEAVGGIFSEMARFMRSSEFQMFLGYFMQTLPDAMAAFGEIGKQLFRGFAAVFEAVTPMAMDFLGWIAGVLQEFADWAALNPDKITGFFERAADSAEVLGDFIADVSKALGELLFSEQGRKAGNTMFTSMSDALGDFVNFIKEAQKSGDLERWFDNGVEVAQQLGKAVKGILRLFDELDTPENRDLLMAIFEGLGAASSIFIDSLRILQPFIAPLIPLIEAFSGWLAGIADSFHTAADGVAGFYDLLSGVFSSDAFQTALDWFGKLVAAVSLFMDPIQTAIRAIAAAFQWLWDFLFGNSIIPDMIAGFENFWGILVSGWNPVGRILQTVVGWFQDFGKNIGKGLNRVGNAVQKAIGFFHDLPGKIGERLGRAVDRVRDFVEKVRNWIGEKTKGPLNRMTNYFKEAGDDIRNHLAKAWDRVTHFLGQLKDLPGKVRDILDNMVGWFRDLPGKIAGALVNVSLKIATFVSNVRAKFGDMVTAIRERMNDAVQAVRDKWNEILDSIRNIGDQMGDAAKSAGEGIVSGIKAGLSSAGGMLGDLTETVKDAANGAMGLPKTIPGPGPLPDIKIPAFARGGVVTIPTFAALGERGSEAVVPLNLPTSQVDPSVRALAGYANTLLRGSPVPGTAETTSTGRSIDVGGITIITPTEDPAAVANETIARLATTGYIA